MTAPNDKQYHYQQQITIDLKMLVISASNVNIVIVRSTKKPGFNGINEFMQAENWSGWKRIRMGSIVVLIAYVSSTMSVVSVNIWKAPIEIISIYIIAHDAYVHLSKRQTKTSMKANVEAVVMNAIYAKCLSLQTKN